MLNNHRDHANAKKLYLFVTMNIANMGGVQAYVAGKCKYLKEIGWNVNILYSSLRPCRSKFKELNQYIDNDIPELAYPPYFFSDKAIRNVINRFNTIIKDDYKHIIVESHGNNITQWGEIIAKELKGKHIIILVDEYYHRKTQNYVDKINFYIYKFHRREVMGSLEATHRLFDGHCSISEEYVNTFMIDEEPVQDVENERIDSIKKYDYNICYIGRTNKDYVHNIIKGVAKFSRKHSDKQVQFIIIGKVEIVEKEINEFCIDVTNLYINRIGEVVPIPRSLFQKVDVVIAGAGSARCSAYEGVKTIVAGIEECLALGVLGYDTQDSTYWNGKNEKLPFDKALEKVLIDKAFDEMAINYPKNGVDYCTTQNFEAISRSEQTQEYYDIDKLTRGTKINYLKFKIAVFLFRHFTTMVKFIKKHTPPPIYKF